METLIILPGNSPKNKEWGEAVKNYFGPWFDEVCVQEYEHWRNGNEVMDFEKEIEKLRDYAASKPESEFYIFGKSFGAVLAILAAHAGAIHPKKNILFGLPLNRVTAGDLFKDDWSWLRNYRVPSLAFHNQHDPIADYEYTKAKLVECNVSVIKLISTDGTDHIYGDFEAYTEIKNFLFS